MTHISMLENSEEYVWYLLDHDLSNSTKINFCFSGFLNNLKKCCLFMPPFPQVYAYHRSLPMPITSHKFGALDPVSGQEIGDDNGLFVSSVCWREKSNMVVAANSNGNIKLLEIV